MLADAFRRLPSGFQGLRITGVGFDRDTLQAAGVEDAFAFAAVSDGDNSNILAARVVRETYGVENVVARIADPGRAEVYRRLGHSHRGAGAVDEPADRRAPACPATSALTTKTPPRASRCAGSSSRRLDRQTVAALEAATGARVAYVVRFGNALLPTSDTLIQDGDDIHAIVPIAATARAWSARLSKAPKAAS